MVLIVQPKNNGDHLGINNLSGASLSCGSLSYSSVEYTPVSPKCGKPNESL